MRVWIGRERKKWDNACWCTTGLAASSRPLASETTVFELLGGSKEWERDQTKFGRRTKALSDRKTRLETTELLGGLLGRLVLGDLEDVETNSLGEGAALADRDGVTDLDTESGRDVGGNVLVALLVSRVLGDEVKVLSADDDGAGHLGRDNLAGQDTATDRDETSPGALLVCKSVPGMRINRKVQEKVSISVSGVLGWRLAISVLSQSACWSTSERRPFSLPEQWVWDKCPMEPV